LGKFYLDFFVVKFQIGVRIYKKETKTIIIPCQNFEKKISFPDFLQ